MGKHVIVGAGQVGRHLAELLATQGHDVTVVAVRPGPGRTAERARGAPAPRIARMPRWVFNAIGVVSPLVRELRETRYQFDRPFVVDSSAFESTFGIAPTPIDEALEATLEFYRP
jgi:nucleoside-diphosphate-sugar epimerase